MSRPLVSGRDNDDRYNIRVLDRAIRILTLLSDGKLRSPAEIAESIGLSPSTTFRMLSTLSYHRFVQRNEKTNQYKLGLACLELAQNFIASDDIRQAALPDLEALRDETKETVHLVVLDRMQIVYLEKLPGLHAIGLMSSRVGLRSPAYCTGVGKALLAYQKPEQVCEYYQSHGLRRYTDSTITDLDALMKHLEQIRQQGFALDKGEHEEEVRCVAAPIFDINGKVVAAISISGPAIRMDPIEKNKELIEQAKQTAMKISSRLGYIPPK